MKYAGYVIRGWLKGKRIPAVIEIAGHSNTTPQKLKESLFQIIENNFPNLYTTVFYDLCAGSGQVGVEAISRNFLFIIFCEVNPQRFSKLSNWLLENNFNQYSTVLRLDFMRGVRQAFYKPPYGLAEDKIKDCNNVVLFIDPPYSFYENDPDSMQKLLASITKEFQKSFYQEALICVQAPSRECSITALFDKKYEYSKNQLLIKKFSK